MNYLVASCMVSNIKHPLLDGRGLRGGDEGQGGIKVRVETTKH